jgi:cell division inhibitor SepF
MASFWQKTLYYLGLVDEGNDDIPDATASSRAPSAPTQAEVRTVDRAPAMAAGTAEPVAQTGEVPPAVPGRRVEPPAAARRRISGDPELAEAGVLVTDTGEEPTSARFSAETEVVVARVFGDAQLVADHLRRGVPVVLDLRSTEPEMVRRLVDFASGLTYALDGTMKKVGQGVILVAPARMNLSSNEKQRLTDLGLYDLGDF